MSRYSVLNAKLMCPFCGDDSGKTVFICFGEMNFIEYKIGDKVRWEKFDSIPKGGRPAGGNMEVVESFICGKCDNEVKVSIFVVSDVIQNVRVKGE